jgi:peptidoglycan/xylan/chitin deacetylase (PgdA/CDA1 family)
MAPLRLSKKAFFLSLLTIVALFISAEETYEIKGDHGTLSGSRLRSMLAWRSYAESLPNTYKDSVFINMDPNENIVYLTFDDGPDPRNTLKVIETLVENGVSGTFFFLGEFMNTYPEIVKKAFDAGFSIGLHGYDHTSMRKLTKSELTTSLNKSNDVFYRITGSRTAIMRPPYGDVGASEIETILDLNYRIHLWSLDTLDWHLDTNDILSNIQKHIRPGDIILMHSGFHQTKAATILPRIIEHIQQLGYEMMALESHW